MQCPQCGKEEFRGCGNHGWEKGEGLLCTVCGWKIPEYVPSPDKMIIFPKDIEYFKEHPAPIMENLHRMHYTIVNSTIPFFGPILYFLARQFGSEQILEIGHAEGYSSFYLAHAVKDNGTRFGMTGNRYYGVDIVQTETTKEKLEKEGLPVTVVNMDSMLLKPETFNVTFDMIFQDGNHSAEYVVAEFENLWPALKAKGDGYWIAHDSEGPAWEGCRQLRRILKEKQIPHDIISLGGQYGLMIIRKMEGFDYDKNPWA